MDDIFKKLLKGSSDAKRAVSSVAKYFNLNNKRMEGKRPPSLTPSMYPFYTLPPILTLLYIPLPFICPHLLLYLFLNVYDINCI
jgi:hypothetical protein